MRYWLSAAMRWRFDTCNSEFGRPLGRAVQHLLLRGFHIARMTLFVNSENITENEQPQNDQVQYNI